MEGGRPFHFRHFSLMHHQSTMKVGTDAVLLATWADATDCNNVLDIGTGCGIIPLMLAQRFSNIFIEAVDIDLPSVEEASENFMRSRWRNRLKAFNADITNFSLTNHIQYDLIVSNPPFFTSVFKTRQERRNLARHADSLSFDQLAQAVRMLLNAQGRFALVLPDIQFRSWNNAAIAAGLHLGKIQEIIPVEGKAANRFNMEYSLNPSKPLQHSTFTIRLSDGNFSMEYKKQLSDFYLGLTAENTIFTG